MLNKDQDAVQLQKILTRGQALSDAGDECRFSADDDAGGTCSNNQHGELNCLECSAQLDMCVRTFIRQLPLEVDPRTLSAHRQCYSCSLCVYKCDYESCITCGKHLEECGCSSAKRKRSITMVKGRLWDCFKQVPWTPWRIPDGDHGLCRCCEACQDKGLSEEDCQCVKCKSCGDCENFCDEVWCETCGFHSDECGDGVTCQCCEDCAWAFVSECKCECVKCESCGECENSCDVARCATCFSHLVDGLCQNCGVTRPLNGEGDRSVELTKPPMPSKRAFRNWSKTEKSIMRSLFSSGMPLADIATHLDRTENAVVVQLANLGLLSEVDLSNAVHQAQMRYRRATRPDSETPF